MKLTKFWFSRSIFIDRVKLTLNGGHGGNGKSRTKSKGGDGGNIFLIGNSKFSLSKVIEQNPGYQITANHGETLCNQTLLGESGADKYIKVPTGIDVSLKDGKHLGTINNNDEKMLVCRGGYGGGPKNNYLGQRGEIIKIVLDLKLIADVGLVGFPNAGKSTLLSQISGANVKIASYAFTTLHPQVCSIRYPDRRQITMSDLPGIVEGSHLNFGLGHQFLKHIERTKMLLFVVDVFGFRFERSKKMTSKYRSVIETIFLLNRELELYDPTVLNKPIICVLNKVDHNRGQDICDFAFEEICQKGGLEQYAIENGHFDNINDENKDIIVPSKGNFIQFKDVFGISAKTGYGVDILKERIRECLDELALNEKEREIQSRIEELKREFPESTLNSSLV